MAGSIPGGGRVPGKAGNIPGGRSPGADAEFFACEATAAARAAAWFAAAADSGVDPVRRWFMSSPEHWKTSMYRCFLPNTMYWW